MTRLGTALRPRGPLLANRTRTLFAFPRLLGKNTTRQAAGAVVRGGLPGLFGRGFFNTPVFSRGAFQPLTRQGTRLIPRGQILASLTRTAILPTIVNMAVGHVTFTPVQSFAVLRDTVVDLPSASDESFTGGATFTIEQGGTAINLTTAHLTFTPTLGGTGFSVTQSNINDHDIPMPTGHMTFTGVPFSVVYENGVQLPTGHMTFACPGFDVSITLPGPQTLTQTDILAIWNNISISGFTPESSLELIAAALMGRLNDALIQSPSIIQIMSIDGSKVVITAQVDEAGNRLKVTLTP